MRQSEHKVCVPSNRDFECGMYTNECNACKLMFSGEKDAPFCKLCSPRGTTSRKVCESISIKLTRAEKMLIVRLLNKYERESSIGVKGLETLYDLQNKLKRG